MISKLQLRAFYEEYKDEYYACRNSGELSRWDEAYKWDVFPKLNELYKNNTEITASNLPEIVEVLKKNNPQQGSFVYWTEVDNLNILTKHTNGWRAISPLWQATPDDIGGVIDTVDDVSDLLINHKFSNAMYGYILAARDCSQFAIYHSSLVKKLVELGVDDKPKTKAEKYVLLNDSSIYLGELMQVDRLTTNVEQKALNGHDFMWVVCNGALSS